MTLLASRAGIAAPILSETTLDASDAAPFLTGGPLARAPSQKELAYLLRVSTRHLRRWESAEAAAGRPCSRPYTAADLWRLYAYRRGKGWDHAEAQRLRLAPLFQQFDEMSATASTKQNYGDHFSLTLLMLKSIAWETASVVPGESIPRALTANLAFSAREQLRTILGCERGRTLLVRAFFEAALVSDSHPAPASEQVRLPASA